MIALSLLLAACTKAATRDDASPSTGGKDGDIDCASLFEQPSGSDMLCNEHVMGSGMEIHWRSYATTATRSAVNQRYEAAAARCGASVTNKPPAFSLVSGDKHLNTFDVAPGASHPTCDKNPQPAHRTVILISNKHDRK